MKNIVFCADGTWNGTDVDEDKDGVPDATNVLKLFHLLGGDTTLDSRRLKDEGEKVLTAEGQTVQVAKYLHGVGDSSNPLMRLLGGAFGAGIIARIVRGYTFISREFAEGDRIFLSGFSRGAYTARALAGMISSVGLLNSRTLDLQDKELAYSLGVAAWRMYRERAREKQPEQSIREKLASLIATMPGFARVPLRDEDLIKAPIEAVAVWDTVGALGIPRFDSDGQAMDAFRFADDELSMNVQRGFHAVSLDEQRNTFQPTLWKTHSRIKQYLFAGAHADVGGGYPEQESALSNIALKWMIEELTSVGVRIKDVPADWRLDETADGHRPWESPLFAAFGVGPRVLDSATYGLARHRSLDVRSRKFASGETAGGAAVSAAT